MSPDQILIRLRNEGLVVSTKLRLDGAQPPSPEALALITNHRDELLSELVGLNSIPRLPWQLERLVSAAASGVLELSIPGVPNAQYYVLGWTASYVTGGHDEALRRLWSAEREWQKFNRPALT